MKINDAEQLLGVSKANIRFYEKQGLLSPARSANGYREYSDDDILRLKEIIILRKLGISVEDIARIQCGELNLQDAIESNIIQLENQIKSLNGALKISKQIAADPTLGFPVEHYWNEIHNEEQKGNAFLSIIHDYYTFMLPFVHAHLKTSPTLSLKKNLIALFVTILTYVLVAFLTGRDFWSGLHHMIFGFLLMVIGLFPVYILSCFIPGIKDILKKFHPNTVILASSFFVVIAVIIFLFIKSL